MAIAGMDPAVTAERASHTDGGALCLKRYRHLYESEKRVQARRLEAWIRSELDRPGADSDEAAGLSLSQASDEDGPNRTAFKPPTPLQALVQSLS